MLYKVSNWSPKGQSSSGQHQDNIIMEYMEYNIKTEPGVKRKRELHITRVKRERWETPFNRKQEEKGSKVEWEEGLKVDDDWSVVDANHKDKQSGNRDWEKQEDEETMNAVNSILLEHDYGKKDANDNGSIIADKNSFIPSDLCDSAKVGVNRERPLQDEAHEVPDIKKTNANLDQETTSVPVSMTIDANINAKEEFFEESGSVSENVIPVQESIGRSTESNRTENQEHLEIEESIKNKFENEKQSWGCSWSELTKNCQHGDSCPLINNILELSTFLTEPTLSMPLSRAADAGQKYMLTIIPKRVAQNTDVQHQAIQKTIFKIQDNQRISGFMNNRSSQATPQSMPRVFHPQYKQGQVASSSWPPVSVQALGDITNQQRFYHPTSNSNIVTAPGVSASEAPLNRRVGAVLQCSDCDSKFADHKTFVKHTRNMHQVYQCRQCGESTIGYYSMASHTKKSHIKEPAFPCNCGRNFAEKRGLTKHQNSCTFYHPTQAAPILS